LTIKNISKSYYAGNEELRVLENVSYSVNSGDIITFFGKSGIGKTTLMNISGGLLEPNTGTVKINEIDLNSKSSISKNIRAQTFGYIFQSHCLLPELTIIENLLLPVYIHDYSKKDKLNEIYKYLDLLGLIHVVDLFPHMLSFGENQRISIIRSLINNPSIIFADEPTGNLDENNSNIILDLFVKLNNDYNCTFIIATHDKRFTSISSKCYRLTNKNIRELNE